MSFDMTSCLVFGYLLCTCLKQAWRNKPLISKETVSFRNSFNRIERDPESCSEKTQIVLNSCDIPKLGKVTI